MSILFGFLAGTIPLLLLVGVVLFIIKVTRNSADPKDSLTTKEILIDGGIFLSLITSVVALISIVFAAIDKKFVDVLNSSAYSQSYLNDDVRVAVSIILVAYPIYVALSYYRAKNLAASPERQSIKSLKYLNYVTLAVAGLFVVGCLITTIYKYLGGELGIAFMLKLLTVVLVAGALFAYNYYSIKRDYSTPTRVPHLFAIASLVLVAAAVIYSVSVIGSPAEVRKARFDDKRLADLSNIQDQVLQYWQRTKTLPAKLSDINGDGFNYGFVLPSDPKTKELYGYNIVENSKTVRGTPTDCSTYYRNRVVSVRADGSSASDFSQGCDMPSKATFEICGNFETVRAYDENGVDQSPLGWQKVNSLGVAGIDASAPKYYYADNRYYPGDYQRNPNWNHDATHTCFKRIIDPLKYPQY